MGLRFFIIIVLLLTISTFAFAQNGPGPGDGGPADVPIAEGILLLVESALGLGIKTFSKKKK